MAIEGLEGILKLRVVNVELAQVGTGSAVQARRRYQSPVKFGARRNLDEVALARAHHLVLTTLQLAHQHEDSDDFDREREDRSPDDLKL